MVSTVDGYLLTGVPLHIICYVYIYVSTELEDILVFCTGCNSLVGNYQPEFHAFSCAKHLTIPHLTDTDRFSMTLRAIITGRGKEKGKAKSFTMV